MDEETTTESVVLCPHCRAIVPEEYLLEHHMFHKAISEMAKAVKLMWADFMTRSN